MRLKILHWQPEFHSWSPTFSHLATEKKKGQSPVGAYLKKLISDPVLAKEIKTPQGHICQMILDGKAEI